MKKYLAIVYLFTASFSLLGNEVINHQEIVREKMSQSPQYLYKILSLKNWQATQNSKTVQLSTDDDEFIHLSTEDQLERIIKKYWTNVPELVVLKIDSSKLEGELLFEANPGGSNKYYHLYNGFIPFNSIVESKVMHQKL